VSLPHVRSRDLWRWRELAGPASLPEWCTTAHADYDVRLRLDPNQRDAPVERTAFRCVVAGDGLRLAQALRHQPSGVDPALDRRFGVTR